MYSLEIQCEILEMLQQGTMDDDKNAFGQPTATSQPQVQGEQKNRPVSRILYMYLLN